MKNFLCSIALLLCLVIPSLGQNNPSYANFNSNDFTRSGNMISAVMRSNIVTALASNYVGGVNGSNVVRNIASNYTAGVIPTFDPHQFGGASGGTNLIQGALATNLVLQTTGAVQLYPDSSLKFNILGGNTNGSIISVTNFNIANGLTFHLFSTNTDQRRSRLRIQGMTDVTNVDASLSRVLTTGTNMMMTNGTAARWASLGVNSTNTGTNVATYVALAAFDGTDGISVSAIESGFRRENSGGLVLENFPGALQKSLRVDSLFSGNRVEAYNGLWLGTNATEYMVISGPGLGAGSDNLHWANRMVITNQFHAGTNNLDGPGSTPTFSYGTNYHSFSLPKNSVVWSIVGDGSTAGEGSNYIWVPVVAKSSLMVGSNSIAIHGSNDFQVAHGPTLAGPNRNTFEVNSNVFSSAPVVAKSSLSVNTNATSFASNALTVASTSEQQTFHVGTDGKTWVEGDLTTYGGVTNRLTTGGALWGPSGFAYAYLKPQSSSEFRVRGNGVIGFTASGSDAGPASSMDIGLARVAAGVASFVASGDDFTKKWFQWGGEARMTTNQTTTSATMANMGLNSTLPLLAGRTYGFHAQFFLSDSTAIDGAMIDFDGGSATATDFVVQTTAFDTALNLSTQSTALATDISASTFTGAGSFECHGTITVNAGGTFVPRFAQVSHSTGTLTLRSGSRLLFFDMP